MPRRHANPIGMLLVAVALATGATGCASYRIGAESLYAPDVQTVYVPMVESDSFRRDLGERLTEAIVREIQLKTPYQVVSNPNADAVLTARIVTDVRRVLVEDPYDAPRALENSLMAEVSFVNRRRASFTPAPPQQIQVPGELVAFSQTNVMVPALGQSVTSSQQVAIERLAQQIVGSMEQAW